MPTSNIPNMLTKIMEELFTEDTRDLALKKITSPEFGYFYGPYVVSQHKDFSKDEFNELYKHNEIIRYLASIDRLINMVKEPTTSAQLKSEIVHMMHNTDKGFQSNYKDLGMTMLHKIREYTFDNKLLESAMTGYAPIVPYEGVTSKAPDIASKKVNIPKSEDDNTSFAVINYIIKVIESNPSGSLLPYLKKLLTTYPFQIMECANLQLSAYTSIELMPACELDRILIPDPALYQAFPHMLYMYAYYFFSALVYSKWDMVAVTDFLKKYVASCDIIHNNDAMEAINYMLNQDPNTNPESVLEEWGIDETYMEKQMEEIARHDPSEIEETFDLSQLANHIYRSRKYQISEYINSLFLSKNPELEVHSFYRDGMLIAQLDQRYIITPVTDIADDYKAKMIMMDSDNEIIIEDGLRVHRATDNDGNIVDQITSDTENQ